MNAHRLHFLRRFANAINTAVTMAPDMSHQTQLHHALMALQQTRKAGIAADEALTEIKSQDQVPRADQVKVVALELPPEEIAAILTQPIIWQEQQQLLEPTIVEEPIIAPIAITSFQVTTLAASLPSATAVYPQKKKSVVNLTQKMATTYFQTLPWQTPVNSVSGEEAENTYRSFQHDLQETAKIFLDPWNTELASQFFSTVSWMGKSVQRVSISAGDGATDGTIEPNIITTSIVASQYLQPVNQFFGQLPWGGSRLH
ncbi:hypothetical protein FK216_11150 [Moraxellaceae bacterium AER2_44_116]|nr:hypothetical protein [Moraxellaceae bacterium]TQC96802.1 hypothetical protein FK216_11150 [Moraxellaceae bacterium AER2_44_116]